MSLLDGVFRKRIYFGLCYDFDRQNRIIGEPWGTGYKRVRVDRSFWEPLDPAKMGFTNCKPIQFPYMFNGLSKETISKKWKVSLRAIFFATRAKDFGESVLFRGGLMMEIHIDEPTSAIMIPPYNFVFEADCEEDFRLNSISTKRVD